MRLALLAATLVFTTAAHAQFEIQDSHSAASFRGIHSIGNGVAWASGTEGTVLRTTDEGATWQRCTTPPDAEKLDFRGIQAFDQNTAIVMSSGKGDLSRLYKTTDGCKSWKLSLTNSEKDGFWDAMQFSLPKQSWETDEKGWLLGDPVNDRFFLMFTLDGGRHWKRFTQSGLANSPDAHGAFAASNSLLLNPGIAPDFAAGGWLYTADSNCILGAAYSDPGYCIKHLNFSKQKLPIANDTETSGIFSLASGGSARVAVGGDYKLPDEARGTAAYLPDIAAALPEWHAAQIPPHGYRSAVTYDPTTKTWITVGPNGTDISRDDGRNWSALRPTAQDTADADKNWNALSLPFVVGPKGRIGKLRPNALQH
jgi:hypothetical protein